MFTCIYINACIRYMSMYVYVFYVCLYGYSNVKCVCVCTCVCVLCIIYHVSCTMYQVSCITYHVHVYACTCMFVHTYYVCVENRHTYVYCIYFIYMHILTYIIVAKIKAHVLPLPFWHSSECRMIVQKSFQPINVIAQLISTQCIQICDENKC